TRPGTQTDTEVGFCGIAIGLFRLHAPGLLHRVRSALARLSNVLPERYRCRKHRRPLRRDSLGTSGSTIRGLAELSTRPGKTSGTIRATNLGLSVRPCLLHAVAFRPHATSCRAIPKV